MNYWVNPTDFSGTAALDSSSLASSDANGGPIATYALQNPNALTYSAFLAQNWTGRSNFGDLMMGTNLADVAPPPPSSRLPSPSRPRPRCSAWASHRSASAIVRRRARVRRHNDRA